MLTKEQEKELIGNCISGDKASWDQFVSQYTNMVYSYITKTLAPFRPVKTKEIVDDLPAEVDEFYQEEHELYREVFVALMSDDFRKLKSFSWKNNSSFTTWLKKVVHNLALDYARKHTDWTKRKRSLDAAMESDEGSKQTLIDKLPDRPWGEQAQQKADKQPAWADVLFDEEEIDVMRKQVQEQVKELSASDQLLLRLICDDVSVEDIAKHMNKSVEAVYMQKTRVLGKLRQELQKKNVSY